MGAYLSEPITEKNSTEGENEEFSFGASSMQGWRVSQEVMQRNGSRFRISECGLVFKQFWGILASNAL